MRKLWKRWRLIVLGTIFTATMASACRNQQTQENTKTEEANEKVLSYSVYSSIQNLDPQKINQLDASTIGYHIYEGLVRNEEGSIVPAGAEDWKISEDGLVYTFTLRDTYWKDGTKIKAQDYVRGIRRLASEETGSDYSFLVHSIKNGAAVQQGALPVKKLGIKAVDDDQVEITLEKKTEYFLEILSLVQFSPVPKEATKEAGEEFGKSTEYLWENGPFYVAQWESDQIILKKNDRYWNADAVSLDQVKIIKKDSIKEAKAAYENGETNLLTTYFPSSGETEQGSGYVDGQFMMIRMNLEQKQLSNENFRKALLYCVDQEALNEQIYQGMQSPAYGFVLPELLPDTADITSCYDVEKAKEYMKKAKKKLKWKKKKPWKFTLVCSNLEQSQQTAAFLKETWEENLGIEIEIKSVSTDECLTLEAEGDFDLILTQWLPDYGDAMAYLENWVSDSPYNQGAFSSKAYDKKIKQSSKKEGEERQALLQEAENILLDKVPAIPLYFRNKVLMMRSNIEGLRVYYVGYQYDYIYVDIN